MKSMHVMAGTFALMILVLGAAFYEYRVQGIALAATSPSIASSGAEAARAVSVYTLADVAQHEDASSCWSAINGKVYDLAPWISRHPGGPQAILSICGTDGSAAFNAQHGGQRRPENELVDFFIGNLVTS